MYPPKGFTRAVTMAIHSRYCNALWMSKDNRSVVIGREIFFSRPYWRIARQPVVKRPDRSSLAARSGPFCPDVCNPEGGISDIGFNNN
jgi:hypothetical protein